MAGSASSAESRAALEILCAAYWYPLYAFLRRRGLSSEAAADAVQRLFTELLEKRRFAIADPTRGRFRSWLLRALLYSLSRERARESAAKRGGRVARVAIDLAEAELRWRQHAYTEQSPEQAFERAWAITVLERAVASARDAYVARGRAVRFDAIHSYLASPRGRGDLQELGVALGISEAAIKNEALRIRRAVQSAIRAEIRVACGSESDVEAEVRALFGALGSEFPRI